MSSSFYSRGFARYFAASVMARRERPSSTPKPDEVLQGVCAWNQNMRWLIPFVQASEYRIVIENPKSHQKIVIDKDTKEFPLLSDSWLRRYDKHDLETWMAEEKEAEEARRVAEARGRAKFGNGYIPTEQEIQEVKQSLHKR
ncbi:MAG: hypothetical protein IJ892_07685 [Prevotella sp.]|jgi:peroxiredoxin|nr:hypothetical protein [Prevotella sp.]